MRLIDGLSVLKQLLRVSNEVHLSGDHKSFIFILNFTRLDGPQWTLTEASGTVARFTSNLKIMTATVYTDSFLACSQSDDCKGKSEGLYFLCA